MVPTQPNPSVPPGTRVYAVGDIHGRADLLGRLLGMIEKDAASSGAARGVLVFLGDYVDRGPESDAVIDLLLEGISPGFETVFLKGNHEQMMLDFLDRGLSGEVWLANGGRSTLAAYDVDPFKAILGDATFPDLADELRVNLPSRHRDFLDGLALRHREGDYVFVHAGLRPGVPLAEQEPFDMMWIRGPFLMSGADFGCVVVHGHSIESEPEVRRNRIGIDTGACHTGRLTCLVLEGETRRFIMTR